MHYVEMPLAHPGAALSARAGLGSPEHRDQYDVTWRYMARWCESILILGDDRPSDSQSGPKVSPTEVMGRWTAAPEARLFRMHPDGTVRPLTAP